MTDLTSKSRYLSFLLRHRPESAGLTLDKEGWCDLIELCTNTDLDLDDIMSIVKADEKGRYSLKPADFVVPTHIRANQGHSTDQVRLSFKKAVPPVVLYHGTTLEAWEVIRYEGLKPMKRHHVHLTDDLETARLVGGRRAKGTCILKVDAKEMLVDGISFYLSDNGVWLVDFVSPKYIHLDQA